MSEKVDFLPRVIVEVLEGYGSIHVNFQMTAHGYDTLPSGVKSVFEILDDWTAYCIASIEHMPYMSAVGHYITDRQIRENMLDFLRSEAISHETLGGEEARNPSEKKKERYSFIIHEDDVSRVASKLSTTTHLMKAASSIQRSNLSALIAEFDYLMFRLLRGVCSDIPQLVLDDEESVPVGFLRSGGTLEDWQNEQIERKINQKLRESHDDVVKWILVDIAKMSDLSPVKSSPFYKDFLEVCQRRHIFIHNGGVVNKEYLKRCLAAGITPEKLPKEGDVLHALPDYLRMAAARVYLVGAFVLSITAQKLYPDHAAISFKSLLSASHDFLVANMTKMAERIIDFAEAKSAKFDNDLRLKFAVNRALAKLYEPDVDRDEQTRNAEKVLKRYDWSVTTPIFDLALACIRRDFSNLLDLAKRAHASGLSYREASHFCVFREAREIPGFMDCFPKAPLMIESKLK